MTPRTERIRSPWSSFPETAGADADTGCGSSGAGFRGRETRRSTGGELSEGEGGFERGADLRRGEGATEEHDRVNVEGEPVAVPGHGQVRPLVLDEPRSVDSPVPEVPVPDEPSPQAVVRVRRPRLRPGVPLADDRLAVNYLSS